MFGNYLTQYKQVGVSIDRMLTLLQDAPKEALVAHSHTYLRGQLPDVPFTAKTEQDRLERLDVTGLTYTYPDSGRE